MNLDTLHFRTIPKADISFELAMEYLAYHNFSGWNMQDIPQQYLNDTRFIDTLVDHLKTSTIKLGFDTTINFIPKHLQTYELLTLLVKRSGWNLHGDNLNTELLTPELVNLAVNISPDILDKSYYKHHSILYNYVSEASLINFVTSSKIRSITPLENIPDNLKTYDICYSAISTSPYNWRFISKEFFDKPMVMKILESFAHRNLMNRGYPSKTYSKEFMKYLFKNHLNLIDNEVITYFYRETKCLDYIIIPKEFNSPELWSRLVKINPKAYQWTPKEFKTVEFVKEVYTPELVKYLGKKFR